MSEDTDALITKELNELSMQEREKVFEDIHGVANEVKEEPEFVVRCLREMDDEIGKIRKKPSYERAAFLPPAYVQNEDFRLMFLRADRFDPTQAAKRMVKFFELKMELFGEEKLVKTITLDDFSEDDLHSLTTGSSFFLKSKDCAGRCILLSTLENERYKEIKNLVSP